MSLIKCSKCNYEVSSEAKYCPNCGNPIKEQLKEEKKDYPKPISTEWIAKYKRKRSISLFIFLILPTLCIVLSTLLVICRFYYICFLIIINIGLIVFSPFMIGISYKEIDGYTVLVYAGFFRRLLVIEDKIYLKSYKRDFDGVLPNEKHIHVHTSFLNSSTFTIVTKTNEKNNQ